MDLSVKGDLDILLGRAKRPQLAFIFTEDNWIVEESLDVEKLYMNRKKHFESYYLMHELAFPVPKRDTTAFLLTERDATPLVPYNVMTDEQKKLLADTSHIAEETLDYEARREAEKGWSDQIAVSIRFAITVMALCFALIIIMFLTGKCSL